MAVEKQADAFGRAFAEKHVDDSLHYYVGAGALFGITYSYAMCYCEEMHWLRTKSIHSAEFFHGMLEIVERDTPVTVIIGEDSQRCLGQRVRNFLPRICGNYEIIDTKDYPMPGFDEAFRGRLQNAILHRVINRMDMHLEQISCHPMENPPLLPPAGLLIRQYEQTAVSGRRWRQLRRLLCADADRLSRRKSRQRVGVFHAAGRPSRLYRRGGHG